MHRANDVRDNLDERAFCMPLETEPMCVVFFFLFILQHFLEHLYMKIYTRRVHEGCEWFYTYMYKYNM